MSATSTVSIAGLRYSYPTWADRPSPVLCDLDLELGPGLHVLTGDSGSGKSTLLRVLNGLVPHFHGGRLAGRAVVCGLDVVSTPTRRLARRVGFVFQEPEAGFVRGTVRPEIAFGPENMGLAPDASRRLVDEAMDRVGIAPLAGRRVRTLSGGERQRVALAAALAAGPAVVALDEPLSQLDDSGARALSAMLAALADDGHTVVVAEHRVDRLPPAPMRVMLGGGVVDAPAPGPPDVCETAPPTSTPLPGPVAWSLQRATIGVGAVALVADLDLAGSRGEVLVVTGPNGSGKTTLLRTIAGLAPPLAGSAERRPGRVAYLPQEPGVLLHRSSVRAEIEQTLRWTQRDEPADPILALLGIADIAERDPRDLSVGQRQRAALAAVLAGQPDIALLDEPTRGMDRASRATLAAALRHLAERGTAVVLATHDQHLAGELGGRRMRIADGVLRDDMAGAGR